MTTVVECRAHVDCIQARLQFRLRQTYPRFGLDTGQLFLIIRLNHDYDRGTYEATIWDSARGFF